MQVNHPALWRQALMLKQGAGHKYDYGQVLIYAAPLLTGATRLAAEACARVGAGLVTVLAQPDVAPILQASLPPHLMVRPQLAWQHAKTSARLYGPGGMATPVDFASSVATVLDADALVGLLPRLSASYVLTPHEGEFARAFPALSGPRPTRALAAARQIGAHVVLKGAQTIIAGPDGRLVINQHDSPHLATAGSGDVLAGMITGLLAQGLEPLLAASAAVWMHGEAARRFGPGLVASDLPGLLPSVLRDLPAA
jgi:NAD(P)H-hydrate epimerase